MKKILDWVYEFKYNLFVNKVSFLALSSVSLIMIIFRLKFHLLPDQIQT